MYTQACMEKFLAVLDVCMALPPTWHPCNVPAPVCCVDTDATTDAATTPAKKDDITHDSQYIYTQYIRVQICTRHDTTTSRLEAIQLCI